MYLYINSLGMYGTNLTAIDQNILCKVHCFARIYPNQKSRLESYSPAIKQVVWFSKGFSIQEFPLLSVREAKFSALEKKQATYLNA